MKPNSARAKGQRFERFIAEQIKESGLDNNAGRQPMSGAGWYKGDIRTSLNWVIEAKHQKTLNWWQSIDQAKREAQQGNQNPDNWILIVNDPRAKPEFSQCYAVIDMWKWLELLDSKKEPIKTENRQLKYKIEKATQAIKELLKEYE
jgi:hypothetical protein